MTKIVDPLQPEGTNLSRFKSLVWTEVSAWLRREQIHPKCTTGGAWNNLSEIRQNYAFLLRSSFPLRNQKISPPPKPTRLILRFWANARIAPIIHLVLELTANSEAEVIGGETRKSQSSESDPKWKRPARPPGWVHKTPFKACIEFDLALNPLHADRTYSSPFESVWISTIHSYA